MTHQESRVDSHSDHDALVEACDVVWPYLRNVLIYSAPPNEFCEAVELIGKLTGQTEERAVAREASARTCHALAERFKKSIWSRKMRPEHVEQFARDLERGITRIEEG